MTHAHPDWHSLTNADFVEWAYLEGVDSVSIITSIYEHLPCRLKAIWWTMHTARFNIWLKLFARHITEEPGPVFWEKLRENSRYMRPITQDFINKSAWLQSSYQDWFISLCASPEGDFSKTIQDILSEKISHDEAERMFQAYVKSNPLHVLADFGPETKESSWDKLWFSLPPDQAIIGHPDVPMSRLDKWRTMPHPLADSTFAVGDYIILTGVRTKPNIPEHWHKYIQSLDHDPDSFNIQILGEYLNRPDVPIKVRKPYRHARDYRLRAAAWKHGEYTKEELAAVRPTEQQLLSERHNIDKTIISHLAKSIVATASWRSLSLSDEAKEILLNRGDYISWPKNTPQHILDLGLTKSPKVLHDMAESASHQWGSDHLARLLHRLLDLPETRQLLVKRLIHLGDIKPDIALIKKMLTSKSRDIRLLGSKLAPSVGQQGTNPPSLAR